MLGLNIYDLEAQTYLLDSSTHGTTISTCGGSFYDSGGPNSPYSSNEDYSITFCSPDGQQLDFDFETVDFFIEGPSDCLNDRLRIYDGADSTAPLLGIFCLDNSPGNIRSTSNCIHFTFSSNGGTNTEGWAASISCFSADEICGNGYDDNQDGSIDEFCSSCNTGSISFDRWLNISGSSLSNLTSNSNFPNNPSESGSLNAFQGPAGYADNYGTRVQGYLVPQESGLYQFTVTSDDNSEFYLSTNGNPNNKVLLASVPGWTQASEFDKYPEQESVEVNLIAGAHYYTEFLHKEGGGGDHLQVYWTTPSNSTRTIVAGSFLTPYECCQMDAGSDTSICHGASITLSTLPSGQGNLTYSWSPSTGLSSSSVQNPIATPTSTTTYHVTVTDDSGCTASDDIQITVIEEIIITVSDENICLGETSNIIPSATGDDPFNYDWGTAATNNNALTVSPTVSTSYILTVTDNNGCSETETVQVIVDPLPTVSLSLPNTDVCINEPSFNLSGGSPAGGTYSGPGVGNGIFDASDAGIGTHIITYSYTDDMGCVNQISDELIVSNGTITSLTLPFEVVCEEETNILLSGHNPTGGTFSGPGVTGIIFNANEAGVGNHTITYIYDDGICENIATDQIIVNPTPNVTFTLSDTEICFGSDIELTGGLPVGGSYSGPGVSGNNFNSLDAGAGSFDITYSFTSLDGCTGEATETILVHDFPSVDFEIPNPITCVIEESFLMEGGVPFGGSYSGPGIVANYFTPLTAGVGDHEITYTFTDLNGCTNQATDIISVLDVPSPTLNLADDEVCLNEIITLSGENPVGGTWEGPGVTGNVFNASEAGLGVHTINYFFEVSTCISSVSDVITVYDVPVVSLSSINQEICYGEIISLPTATPSGGYWTGNGIINDDFDSTFAGPGTHSLSYTYLDANGCSDTEIIDITVFEETSVELDLPIEELCEDDASITLSGASPVGGVFSGPGISTNTFDPLLAGPGIHIISYDYTDANGCVQTAVDQIEVIELPNASLDLINFEACPGTGPQNLSGGWPLGGSYSGTAVTGNQFDPVIAGVGTHIITYTVTVNGCTSSATDEFEVFDVNSIDLELTETEICIGEEITLDSNAPAGGNYSGLGVNPWTGTFSSVVAGLGTHTILYEYIDENGCNVELSDEIVVFDVFPATLSLDINLACATETHVPLTGGSPAGGTWSGPGVTGNSFNPWNLGAGTYTITYHYQDGNGCEATAIDEITVESAPNVTFTYEDDHCNLSTGSITFQFQNQIDVSFIEFSLNDGVNWMNPIGDHIGVITYGNLSSGTYELLVRNISGACETNLGTIIIDDIPGPTAEAGPDVTIPASTSTQLNGTGGSFYSWTPSTGLSNTNIQNPIASPTQTTTYTLEVTDIYGCVATDQITVYVDVPCAGTLGEGDFPYTESFESGYGIWSQVGTDDFDWLRNNGSVSSSGPSSGSHGSWYAMAQGSGNANQTSIFRSPCFDLAQESCAQFTFDYFIANSGSLTLQASNDFGNSWLDIWTDSGNQGTSWNTQVMDLFGYLNSNLQLRFVADMGSESSGSMGIDNVEFITTGCGCSDTSSPFTLFDLVPDPQPFSVDIDCDGDADMLAGGDGQLFFFENNGDGTYTDQTGTAQDIMPGLSFLDMTIGLVDLDNDGDKDLSIVGNQAFNKFFFWNTGTKTNPIFTQAGTGGTPANPISNFNFNPLDGGVYIGYADPTIFWVDLDNDGDYDAVVGGKLGWFQYYENIGDEFSPNLVLRTGADNPFNGLRVDGADEGNGIIQYESSPFLIDWDGDGDFDMFSGNQISTVQFFENIGTATNPIFVERSGSANPFDGVIFSEDSHLSILDEDCDGDWDVFYGVGDTVEDAEITVCDLLVAVPNFAQASSDQSHYCLGDPIFLLELSAVGVSWSWSGPNGFSSTDQNPLIPNSTMADAGTYTVTITNEQGCISTSTIDITISETIADAGPDATIDIGDLTQNSGAGNGLTIFWTPATGLSDPTVLNPVASPTATTTYTLTIIDQFGCVATDQMTIFVVGDECSYDEEIFHSDFETTTGDNFWSITNNASDGNFEIGVPSPYIQSGLTVMELNPQEGSQSLITGNATNYNQDLDGGPSIARSININLPNGANTINLSLYWYLSHFINGNSSDYLTIEIRDASNNSVLHTLVDENGAPTDRDAVWTFASLDLSAHAGKTIYIYISAADIGNGSKLEVGIDNVSILGTFSTVADLTLTDNDVCDLDSPITLSGGTPEGGVYAGPGVTGNIFDPSVAGPGVHTISYQYTNIQGCIAVAVEDIEVYESPLVELDLSVGEVCINQTAVGLFGGNPTGGTWSGPGVSESSFYPADAGIGTHTITYTVTDLNGCQNSISDDFIVYEVPIVTNISYTDTYCSLDNGSITIDFDEVENIDNIQFSLNGGFDWLTPIPDVDGQVTYNDLPSTTYDIWVQDENSNCPFQVQILTIDDELGPMVDLGPDINKCRNETETINPIIENGLAPFSYAWTGPNGFVSDQLSNDLIDEGTYQLVVTDANGCTGSDSVELSNFNLSVDAVIGPIKCFGATNGRIRAFANGTSPFKYTIVGHGSNGSGVFNGLAQGDYRLEVEDAYGCFISQTFTVPGPPPLFCSQDSCVRATTNQWVGAANGPFTASAGSTNISIEVNNQSNTDISNFDTNTSLSSSIPRWFVENVEGIPSIELQATWDTDPEAQLSDIDDSDDKGTMTITFNFDEPVNDVVLHIDGLGDFGFDGTNSWSNSSEWKIVDAGLSLKKLSGTADLQVMSDRFFRSPDVSHDMQEQAQYPDGEGSAAGSIAVLASTPVNSISFEVTGIGVEGNGYDNVELAISKSVCYESFPTDYLCDNTPGTATISALGGVHPFTYEWDNGETTQTATNLNPGIHTVTITDANDCLLECTVEIEDNSILIDAGPRFSFCEGDSGSLMPSIIVGAEPFQYQWSGPNGFSSTEENPIVTEGGIYTLNVIDGNNCTATDYVRVYAYSCNETTNCNYLHEFNNFSYYGSDGTLDWFDFGWDETGDNNSAISGDISISNGQLSMQHTDNSEPSIQRQIDLGGHSLGVLSFDFITEGGVDENDQFQVEIFDGVNWTVIFESSGSTSTTHTPWLDIADYLSPDTEIRFTIVSGFSDPGEELLIDNVRIDLDCLCEGNAVAGIDQEICEGDSIQLIGTGVGVVNWEPVAFLTDPTILEPIAFPSETTTFTLTVTDDYGCIATDEITIQVNESVEAEALPLFADYCLDGSGAATVIISQGEGPFTINWESLSDSESGTTIQDNIGSTNIENLNGNTIYCIQIIDSNGCTNSFP